MLLVKLFSRMPFWLLYGLSDFLSWLLYAVVRYRRKVVADNIRHAFPDQTEAWRRSTIRKFYTSFTDVWLESLKSLSLTDAEMRERVSLENPELLAQYQAQGLSTIGLAGHIVNWEWLFLRGGMELTNVWGVYLKVDNPFFDKLMLKIRSHYGNRLIEKGNLLREIVRTRGQMRSVAMVADQAPKRGNNYYWQNFMNRPAPFFTSAEKLVQKEELPLYFVGIARIRRGYYKLWFEELGFPPYPPMPEGTLTSRYILALERAIRQQPENYLWSHKRWKHQPPV
ncbi:lipid A biosynthesis lauroyl acyltransferase [Flammeovirgaceae bacterium 311]|nr:lipid A biosynthesis lauroyl acyltransferase [Flammeovirgaceae bacterium 311]